MTRYPPQADKTQLSCGSSPAADLNCCGSLPGTHSSLLADEQADSCAVSFLPRSVPWSRQMSGVDPIDVQSGRRFFAQAELSLGLIWQG